MQVSDGEPVGLGRDTRMNFTAAGDSDTLRQRLVSHGVLERPKPWSPSASSNDLFVLTNWKRVHVSPEGNRGMRSSVEALALKDGLSQRVIGTIIWSKSTPASKWQMRSMTRLDPLSRGLHGRIRRKVVKKEGGALALELDFTPPLMKGEYVRYGYYLWVPDHYAMTRREAEGRFKDRWIREGLVVREPTDTASISVNLPPRYMVQQAILEKDPVLNVDGPNVPGSEVKKVVQKGDQLTATLHNPEVGRYFLSWIPPE